MKRRDCDWAAIQEEHDSGKSLDWLLSAYSIGRGVIETAIKHGLFIKRHHRLVHSEAVKKAMSDRQRLWLKNNPDKHPWRRPDKCRSVPCDVLKEVFRRAGIVFIEEHSPLEERAFSIDIAIPDKKIGVEVNGGQHYDRGGKLKPYYQDRHDLIEESGWKLIELHHSMVYNHQVVELLIADLKSEGVEIEIDPAKYEEIRMRRIEECRISRAKKEEFLCKRCGKKLSGKVKTGMCLLCAHVGLRRAERPSREELERLINEMPLTQLGKMFGVSDTAVKKWCRKSGVEIGCRLGFWSGKKREESMGVSENSSSV